MPPPARRDVTWRRCPRAAASARPGRGSPGCGPRPERKHVESCQHWAPRLPVGPWELGLPLPAAHTESRLGKNRLLKHAFPASARRTAHPQETSGRAGWAASYPAPEKAASGPGVRGGEAGACGGPGSHADLGPAVRTVFLATGLEYQDLGVRCSPEPRGGGRPSTPPAVRPLGAKPRSSGSSAAEQCSRPQGFQSDGSP